MSDYGTTDSLAMNNALSPVDEDRQSRPKKPKQPPNAASQQQQQEVLSMSTSTSANAPLRNIYQSPAMGTLTPPRSPLAGEVLYHNQQQAIISSGGPITPPRSSSARKSTSKSRKSGSKNSNRKKSSKQNTQTDTEIGVGGVTSSIKKSLSNISLFTSTDGDTVDEEAAASTSLRLYQDEDLTSAHHRAELYGQIGGPTGMIGAFGEKRGCKRVLVLITLAFILLSLVLQRISDGTIDGGNGIDNSGGAKEGTDGATPSSQEIDSYLKGEIGELTPGKCRQIISAQTEDLEEAVGTNDDLKREIRRLENMIDELKERLKSDSKR